jgi:hypothetical protein
VGGGSVFNNSEIEIIERTFSQLGIFFVVVIIGEIGGVNINCLIGEDGLAPVVPGIVIIVCGVFSQ